MLPLGGWQPTNERETLTHFSQKGFKIMKLLQISMSVMLMVILCSVVAAQNREPNSPKHNQVVVEFPGHKYSLEIAILKTTEKESSEERIVPTVFAFVSDTHFEPLKIEAKEVRLNFVVDRKPKSFVLSPATIDPRTEKEPKPQTIFKSNDPELVKLITDGWQGNATANMVVQVGRNSTPYTARLMKAKDFKPHRH
jgi:hypothetical protein